VVQALKENNILAGDVAGHNIYAEATTKVMNAQDAVAMLEAKVPELIKSCVTITPLDKDGKPLLVKDPDGKFVPSTAPAITKENAETGEVTLIWLFETGLDKKYYRETLFPLVKECMDAIAGAPAKAAKMALRKFQRNLEWFNYGVPAELGKKIVDYVEFDWPRRNSSYAYPILIQSFSRNFDRCDYFWYDKLKNNLVMFYKTDEDESTEQGAWISLELLDSEGEVIAFSNTPCWQPFITLRGGVFSGIGPNITKDINFTPNPISLLWITMPIDSAKEIKNVKIELDVKEPAFSLKSSQE
jgi:hypothetical protein